MKAYLQVLSTGTADCPPSVILHFDSQRYMINCGEGTQRLCMQQKVRFSKLKTILFTRTHWDCIGGTPGMLLTLSDVGIRNMRLLGGENLTHAIISTRHFVYRNTMAVDTVEFTKDSGSYRDENLRITAVQVYPDNFERSLPYEWSAPPTSPNRSNSSSPSNSAASPVPKHRDSPVTGSKRSSDELSPSTSTPVAAVEDEQPPKSDTEIRKMILEGMFNLSKSNGINAHPLANKKVKRDPRAPVPQTDVDMIEAARTDFERFQGTGSDKLTAACIVHLGGHSVMSHPEYKAWMQRFGPETQHIIANQEYCSQKLIWRSQAQSCYKLSALDSNIFPLPYYNNTPTHVLSADLQDLGVKADLAESMMTYLLEPSTGLERSEVIPPLELFKDHSSLKNSPKDYLREYYNLAMKAQEEIAKEKAFGPTEVPGKDVVLTALGTGSSHPSKYRNVSATIVETPKHGTFLLDTGEGTYGQMFRQFGGYRMSADQANSVDDRIKNLKGIFISHLHADHHLGIVTLIDRWNQFRTADTDPLYLIAPLKFNSFLQELSDTQDFGYQNVRYIQSEDIVHWRQLQHDHRYRIARPALMSLFETSGFKDIQTVDVIHCPWAYGISMTHKDGWKIVYSGDTRPSQNLVEAGQGATVLLHEATFEDDMEEEALKKRHSTTKEAIMVGEGMEAKHTLLTHFSQRYPKIPRFDADGKSTIIGICFDLMSVRFGEIEHLAKFLPALEVLYSPQSDEAKEGEEEDNDAELKILQKQSQ
ncbi:Zinc phosphodiesterase ELAC protein 2 [Linnemannia elongata]|nr:Zinc phosphodiesterase ELAC protein 2 [Linnemannia elongata]